MSGAEPAPRPQDDLFGHVNAQWLRETDIPADQARYTTFDVLREQAEAQVRDLVTEVAESAAAEGTVARKVGDLYSSFMDVDRVERRGVTPIEPALDAVEQVSDPSALLGMLGRLLRRGVTGVFMPFVNTDDRDSTRYVVYLEQAGIGLPDESYYRDDAHAATRTAYLRHLERILALVGSADAASAAKRVMELETRLAAGHWDRVTNRDPVKTYTLLDRDGLSQLAPDVDWDAFLTGLAAPRGAFDAVVVRQPSFLASVSESLREVPMESWRDWLRWHIVHAHARYLCAEVADENFDFYGRVLTGAPEQRERWKRAVALVEGALGEAVGQLYVERHFPPHAKAAMLDLVGNLVEAFRRDFADLPWMGEGTREEALTKLESFVPKIGYPDTWRDYTALDIDPADLIGNVHRAAAFEVDRDLAKLGGPVDRGEWFMTPQTVNAYYNPGMNEIVFPAAILQAPFFDVDADPAQNYGGIGAVIGHEIGHGFDDQGSQFDGAGNLRNWWTDADRAHFDERAQRLITQFDELETRDAPGHRINGALTVGENIGDLGGLTIGHAAYRIFLEGGAAAPIVDGMSGEQRFFASWARIWCGKSRDAEAIRLLSIDPHSPVDVRANACRNLTEFHEAFGTQPGDGMWVPEDERVRIF